MTISLVSEQEFHKATGLSTQDLAPITADVGDWLVAVHHQATTAAFGVTLTDSAGNVWVQRAADNSVSGNSRIVVLTCQVTSALSAGTVTLSHGGTSATTINISRWSGVSAAYGASSEHAVSAMAFAPALSILGRGGVIVAGATYNSVTPPSALADGYTALTGFTPASSCYGANAYLIAPDGVVGSTPTWTLPVSAAWGAAAVALVEADITAAAFDEPFVVNSRTMQPVTHIDQVRVVNFVDVLVPTESTVEATASASWHNYGAVTATAASTWNTAAPATAPVTADAAATWDQRAIVSSNGTARWGEGVTVTAAATGVWAAATPVTATAGASWATRQHTEAMGTATWRTRSVVTTVANARWELYFAVTAASSGTWAAQAAASGVASANWNQRDLVDGAASATWRQLQSVQRLASDTWTALTSVTSDAVGEWAAEQLPTPHVRLPALRVDGGDRSVDVTSTDRTVDIPNTFATVEM